MPNRYLVGTVEIRREPGSPHATLTVFNRGGHAGKLTVLQEDASKIAKRLLGHAGDDNPIKSDMYALDVNGERITFTPPEKETTEDNAEAQMAAMQEAERAREAMASATRVIRMSVDVEALGS